MFIYVFSEAAYEKMCAAGFTFVCRDIGAHAWVFLTDSAGAHAVPEDVEKVVTSRMAFNGAIGNQTDGGIRHG